MQNLLYHFWISECRCQRFFSWRIATMFLRGSNEVPLTVQQIALGLSVFLLFSCSNDDRFQALAQRIDGLEAAIKEEERLTDELGRQFAPRSEFEQFLRVTPVALQVSKTGNEVCMDQNQVCLKVLFRTGSDIVDRHDRPCGHAEANCNSRVVSHRGCLTDAHYEAAPIKFWRTPGLRGQCGEVSHTTCLYSPDSLVALCVDEIRKSDFQSAKKEK